MINFPPFINFFTFKGVGGRKDPLNTPYVFWFAR